MYLYMKEGLLGRWDAAPAAGVDVSVCCPTSQLTLAPADPVRRALRQ